MSEVFRCPQCHSAQCVAANSKGEQVGIVAGAIAGAAFVAWTVLSPASAAGRVLSSPSIVSKVSKVGLMIGDIFCGAQAGRALGRYYDQAGEGEFHCLKCGEMFKLVG